MMHDCMMCTLMLMIGMHAITIKVMGSSHVSIIHFHHLVIAGRWVVCAVRVDS